MKKNEWCVNFSEGRIICSACWEFDKFGDNFKINIDVEGERFVRRMTQSWENQRGYISSNCFI